MSPEDAARAAIAELRQKAADCRALARQMSLRIDRETLLDRARGYEDEAARLESGIRV
jgi:hypothetical protein